MGESPLPRAPQALLQLWRPQLGYLRCSKAIGGVRGRVCEPEAIQRTPRHVWVGHPAILAFISDHQRCRS